MSSQDLFAPSLETLRLSVEITSQDLEKIGMNSQDINNFLYLRKRYLQKAPVEWENVEPPPDDFFENYNSLKEPELNEIKNYLNKLVIILLNGGLGTMMGLTKPKCSLFILQKNNENNGITILDYRLIQIEVFFIINNFFEKKNFI